MREIRAGFAVGCVLLCVAAIAACGPSAEEQAAAQAEADLTALEEAKAALVAKRQEMQGLKAELQAEQADAFNAQLADFINANPPIVGEPYTETQLKAIRMKSDEDMVLAQEYIDRGGDYRRAINIYRDALNVDPDNQKLKDAMAKAEEDRFVSEDRFATVRKGMTEDEVRAALGPVNLRNIRKYEDRGVVAWFYPTGEGGAAAAVWFREDKKRGEMVTYQIKFDAVEPGGEQE